MTYRTIRILRASLGTTPGGIIKKRGFGWYGEETSDMWPLAYKKDNVVVKTDRDGWIAYLLFVSESQDALNKAVEEVYK